MIANTSHVLLPVLLTLHENFYMSTHHLSVYYSFISAYIPPDSMYLRKYFHFLIARSHCIEFIAMVKNGQHPVAKGISSNCVELWVPVVLQPVIIIAGKGILVIGRHSCPDCFTTIWSDCDDCDSSCWVSKMLETIWSGWGRRDFSCEILYAENYGSSVDNLQTRISMLPDMTHHFNYKYYTYAKKYCL